VKDTLHLLFNLPYQTLSSLNALDGLTYQRPFMNKPTKYVLNTQLHDTLRSLKELSQLTGESLVVFGIKQALDRSLSNLIFTAVEVCDFTIEATSAEGGTRTLDKTNYWMVIANFELTESIICK
jgi:hypothetical protein